MPQPKPEPPSADSRSALWFDLFSAAVALLVLTLISLSLLGRLPQHWLGLRSALIIIGVDTLACAFFWWEYWQGLKRARDPQGYRLTHGIWLLGSIPLFWPLRWLQLMRLFRPLRHLRIGPDGAPPVKYWARVLMQRPMEVLGAATLFVLVVGATLLYFFERGSGGTIDTWWDAMWLCATSATTDSYGDVAPNTALGRIASVTIAFIGIVLVGSFTAAITGHIIAEPKPRDPQLDELLARLERIEAKLDSGALAKPEAGRESAGPDK